MLAGASNEPDVVGVGFGMEQDALSEPVSGDSGIFVVQLKSKKPAENLPNYAGYKASISNTSKQNIQSNIAEAIKNMFEVIDNRSTYY